MLIDGKATTMKELLTIKDADITVNLLNSKCIFILEKDKIIKICHIRIKATEGYFLAYFKRGVWVETRLCQYSDLGIKWDYTEDSLKNR